MIELRDVGVSYGKTAILKNINLRIAEGESLAIVGESGAGKSTLGKLLLGTLKPTSGQYLYQGEDVAKLRGGARKIWRRKVQAVFQNPTASLNPRLELSRALTEPLEVVSRLSRSQRRTAAADLLQTVGLDPVLADRYPHQISGGQRQRVVIARTLGARPETVVLDEPVSALDVSARAQILNLLVDLRSSTNITSIYITHDLATVGYLCDRLVVLYKGQIVEQLSVQKLTDGPDHPYTQALLSAVVYPGKSQQRWVPMANRVPSGSACVFAHACPFVQPKCVSEETPLALIGAGWESACHYAGEHKEIGDSGLLAKALSINL